MEASIVRLLLLTGCRNSEILTLRWSEYREGRLCLSDSKTGPRTVWLSSAARKVLDDLPGNGPRVFPSTRGNGPHSKNRFDCFWWKIRAEARTEVVVWQRATPLPVSNGRRPTEVDGGGQPKLNDLKAGECVRGRYRSLIQRGLRAKWKLSQTAPGG